MEHVMRIVERFPNPSRVLRLDKAKNLAAVAVVALLAGGTAISFATETPPPANAGITAVYANSGYADLVQAVKPAVVNVRVERTVTRTHWPGPDGPQHGSRDAPLLRALLRRAGSGPDAGAAAARSRSVARARASSSAPMA